jgi:N-acylneuraminate cytidylyltransferase
VSSLAIIPARGGSKRIPRKNVRPFCGKPIISYPIEAALGSGLFEDVMVSTDDREIADVGELAGASVPFLRSEKTADDNATLADVVEETLSMYRARGKRYDTVCCILATAPLVSARDLVASFETFAKENYDSLIPVVRFGYPVFRALKIDGGKVSMIWPENQNARSQDLPTAYHDSGSFYWIRCSSFQEQKTFFMKNTGGLEIPEFAAQDIDTEDDWKLAEMKFELRGKT